VTFRPHTSELSVRLSGCFDLRAGWREAGVEALPFGRHVAEHVARTEAVTVFVGQAICFSHKLFNAPNEVDIRTAPARIRRKAPSEDRNGLSALSSFQVGIRRL